MESSTNISSKMGRLENSYSIDLQDEPKNCRAIISYPISG